MHYLHIFLLDTEVAQSAPWREETITVLTSHLSSENTLAEAEFLRANPSWERP